MLWVRRVCVLMLKINHRHKASLYELWLNISAELVAFKGNSLSFSLNHHEAHSVCNVLSMKYCKHWFNQQKLVFNAKDWFWPGFTSSREKDGIKASYLWMNWRLCDPPWMKSYFHETLQSINASSLTAWVQSRALSELICLIISCFLPSFYFLPGADPWLIITPLRWHSDSCLWCPPLRRAYPCLTSKTWTNKEK